MDFYAIHLQLNTVILYIQFEMPVLNFELLSLNLPFLLKIINRFRCVSMNVERSILQFCINHKNTNEK